MNSIKKVKRLENQFNEQINTISLLTKNVDNSNKEKTKLNKIIQEKSDEILKITKVQKPKIVKTQILMLHKYLD